MQESTNPILMSFPAENSREDRTEEGKIGAASMNREIASIRTLFRRTGCFCFHYDGSRKNVNKIFKNSSAERVEKFVRKPAANFIGRNKSPEFYVTFHIVTRRIGVNKITQPEMR